MVRAVCWVLEVKSGGPVVGEVFRHLASGAGGSFGYIAFHRGVEGIASHNVMHMSGWIRAGLDGGIKALDGKSRTRESKARFYDCGERKSCGKRLHLGEIFCADVVVDKSSCKSSGDKRHACCINALCARVGAHASAFQFDQPTLSSKPLHMFFVFRRLSI
jgi:hypothetical protein